MNITGICVSVDYGKILQESIKSWASGLDRLMIVTSPKDYFTQGLCFGSEVGMYITESFWENGAKFNKGLAISRCFDYLKPASGPGDWLLLFDADIIPPDDWRDRINKTELQKDWLYGVRRIQRGGRMIPDPNPCGWFMFFNLGSPQAKVRPIVDEHWYHAGNYDSTLMERWTPTKRRWLPFTVEHAGDEAGRNWCGIGNESQIKKLHDQRKEHKGWRHETVDFLNSQP